MIALAEERQRSMLLEEKIVMQVHFALNRHLIFM
jgi:hypothetical protein